MLGSLNFRFASPSLLSGAGAGAAAAGALLAALPFPGGPRRDRPRPLSRLWLAACGLVFGAGLIALFLEDLPDLPGLVLAPLFLAGMAASASCRLAADLFRPALADRRRLLLEDLTCASFGLGGFAASLVALVAVSAHSTRGLLPCAAAAPGLLAWSAFRAWRVPGAAGWPEGAAGDPSPRGAPRSALLSAGLLLQACACGLAVTTLHVSLAHAYGSSPPASLAVLAVFWLALAAGLADPGRFLRIGEAAYAVCALALAGAGTMLLHFGGGPLAAVAGTALVGVGMGALFRFTIWLSGRYPALGGSPYLTLSVRAAPAAGLLAGWPVGFLAAHASVPILPLAVLACLAAALAALALLVADWRLAGDPNPI